MEAQESKSERRAREAREKRAVRTMEQRQNDASKAKKRRKPLSEEQKANKARKERERRAARSEKEKKADAEKAKARRVKQSNTDKKADALRKKTQRASRTPDEVRRDARSAKNRRERETEEQKRVHAMNEKNRRDSRTIDEIGKDSAAAKARREHETAEQKKAHTEKEMTRRASRDLNDICADKEKAKLRKKISAEKTRIKNAEMERLRRLKMTSPEKRNAKVKKNMKNYVKDPETGIVDFGAPSMNCSDCGAKRYLGEKLVSSSISVPKFGNCCSNGKMAVVSKPLFTSPPNVLKELLTSESTRAVNFRKHIRDYNNAVSMASTNANFVSRGLGSSKWNPTITIQGRLYHEIGALFPESGRKPRYCAVYIHDTDYKEQAKMFHHFNSRIQIDVLEDILLMMHEVNPYVKTFTCLFELFKSSDNIERYNLVIHADKKPLEEHTRRYNAPASSEIAAIIIGSENDLIGKNDIILRHRAELNENGFQKLSRIAISHRSYDALAYPLLFPDGKDGWNLNSSVTVNGKESKVTPLQFYARYLFEREKEFNIFLHSGRLFQQFAVVIYVKIEADRLAFIRKNQAKIRRADYTSLRDLLGDSGGVFDEATSVRAGSLLILPSTFVGGDRYMRQKMHDIIATSNSLGHPDIFITMTCNPHWPEIRRALLPGQRPEDRPDLCNRVFRMKRQALVHHLKNTGHFGRVVADVVVNEFQKRGLVHSHIILVLDKESKERFRDPAEVDRIVSAEIPPKNRKNVREAVLKHMIHRPCTEDKGAPCKHDGVCSKRFPKPFREETGCEESSSYVLYRRRSPGDGGETGLASIRNKKVKVDNSWVVPYCAELIVMFDCHINFEFCLSRVGSIKYLFKYVCKGSDRVTVEIAREKKKYDEISMFQDARYVSASESFWRMFKFEFVENNPHVERLEVHLPNHHTLYFKEGEEENALEKGKSQNTKLIAWFKANNAMPNSNHIRYIDFPRFFTWMKKERFWKPRRQFKISKSSPEEFDFSRDPYKAVGRIYSVSPREGERYYLRTLLLHKPGARSFEDLRTIDGVKKTTFREACVAMGLLADDSEWRRCLQDAFASRFEPLTKVFSTILVFCEPSDPRKLLEIFREKFVIDIRRRYARNSEAQRLLQDDASAAEYVILEISEEIAKLGRTMEKYGLQSANESLQKLPDKAEANTENLEALRIEVSEQIRSLNVGQKRAFTEVVSKILPGTTANDPFKAVDTSQWNQNMKKVFFLDAPGGTGKTYLMQTIHKLLRCRERNVKAVATSAVAASLLYKGRTAHSTFKIPIPCDSTSTCNISVESKLAQEIREIDLIIWDEIIMCHRYCIEAVDRTLRDITRLEEPFGGKCVLFSGDFRQILPVIPGGSRAQIVHSCFKSSPIFSDIQMLKLHENMRLNDLRKDPRADEDELSFPDFLLRVGEGKTLADEGKIGLPKSVNFVDSRMSDEKAKHLVDSVFEGIETKYENVDWLASNAILTVKNASISRINEHVGNKIAGSYRRYLSADSVRSDDAKDQAEKELCYPQELLNRLSAGSAMPDHLLLLKKGFIVMLLRNIYPEEGHSNGTRYVLTGMTNNLLFLKVASGQYKGMPLTLPRVECSPGDKNYPLQGFMRLQFPIRVCFAMTVNKAQGQSISGKLGLDLRHECFSHGQLYVALSRATHPKNIFVCTKNGIRQTRNVVYPEAFPVVSISVFQQESYMKMPFHKSHSAHDDRQSSKRGASVLESIIMRSSKRSKPSDHLKSQDSEHENMVPTEDTEKIDVDMVPVKEDQSIQDRRAILYRTSGIQITREDQETILQNVYVNDQVISAFLHLVTEKFPRASLLDSLHSQAILSSLIGQVVSGEALRSIFGDNLQGKLSEIGESSILLMPLHSQRTQHWGLAVFSKITATIYIYDSLPGLSSFTQYLAVLREFGKCLRGEFHLEEWPNEFMIQENCSAVQIDGISCGVYVMLNAYYRALHVTSSNIPPIQSENIMAYRQMLETCMSSNNLSAMELWQISS